MSRLTEWVDDHAIPRPDIRNNGHQRCINKLARYEDLEEQGRLIELPCKIGDYVYKIHNNDWKTYFRGEGKELGIIKSVFTYKDIPGIGTLVFLTKEEAEAKLGEVKGK